LQAARASTATATTARRFIIVSLWGRKCSALPRRCTQSAMQIRAAVILLDRLGLSRDRRVHRTG
jgi:hypothetical protein